jgi:hypothetical protein
LYPNFFRQGPIWDDLPPYHGDKLPADYQQGKRKRHESTISDDDDDEETKAYQSFPKPPSVIPCLVREKVDKIQDDNLSDDDFQISSCTVAPTKKREPEKSTAVTSVDIETCIWRFMNPQGYPIIMKNTDNHKEICTPARCLPVFIGLLSLAAVPSCRILATIDLDHARY